MSFTMTSSVRKVRDHFEPEANLDPQEQRALRAHLEQIDYAAFAANREVLAKVVGHADLNRFQRLAIAAASHYVAARCVAVLRGQQGRGPAATRGRGGQTCQGGQGEGAWRLKSARCGAEAAMRTSWPAATSGATAPGVNFWLPM